MHIAACVVSPAETERLCSWIEGSCRERRIHAEICPMSSMDAFWESFAPGAYPCVVLGQEDTAGFLAARRVRELDRACKILMICDTDRYALQSVRLHVTDFILRPVSRPRLERGLDLLLGQR